MTPLEAFDHVIALGEGIIEQQQQIIKYQSEIIRRLEARISADAGIQGVVDISVDRILKGE